MSKEPVEKLTEARLYWLHATTPIHVGSGRGVGFIDLPVMREKVTNWPYVPGSAVKGVSADYHGATDGNRQNKDLLYGTAFGRGGDEASNSGSLVFTDSHLICLPVRSLYGTFSWCTCPLALQRLKRDLTSMGLGTDLKFATAAGSKDGAMSIHVSKNPASVLSDGDIKSPQVFLEDLDLRAVGCDTATAWAESLARWLFPDDNRWQTLFRERFSVVHDDVFSFLCETLQVDARVRIDEDSKTVANGQLWYEESIPPEAILAGIAWCGPVFGAGNRQDNNKRQEILKKFCTGPHELQIGGKATVGRGRVSMTFVTGQKENS